MFRRTQASHPRRKHHNQSIRRTKLRTLERLEDRRVMATGEVQSFVQYSAGVLPENAPQAWIRQDAGATTVNITGGGLLHLKDPGGIGDHVYFARPEGTLEPTDSVIMDAKLSVGLSATTGQLVLGGPNSLGFGFDDTQHLVLLGVERDPGGSGKALLSLNWSGDPGTPKSFLVDNAQLAHTFRIIKHGEKFVEAGIYNPTTDTYESKVSVPIEGFAGSFFGIPGYAFGAFSDLPVIGTSGSFWYGLGAVVGCTAVPRSTEVGSPCVDDGKGPAPGEIIPTGLFGLQIENGNFQFKDSAGHFEFSGGSILVGVNPDLTNGSFLPIFRLTGGVHYTGRTLHADASLQELVTGRNLTLFSGTWETDIWDAKSSFLSDNQFGSLNEFQIAGMDFVVNGLDLLFGGVALHGSFKLPGDLGGLTVGVNNGRSVIITTNGISLGGASICLPQGDFNLLGTLPVEVSDVCVGYDTNRDAVKLQGRLRLPQIYNATADLSGNNYIEVAGGKVSVVGSLSVADVGFPFAGWGLKDAKLFFNSDTGEVRGDARLELPTGITVAVGLGFFGGDINYASLDVDGFDLPTVFPGVFLQRIAGQVDHLSPNDPASLEFGGGVGATFGPEITGLKLPSWAGGLTLGGSLVRVDLNGNFDANHLSAEGPFKILAGLASGNANADLNWDQGTFSGGASLDLLNKVISLTGSFTADTDGNLTVTGNATLRLPKIACPIVCGQRLASATAYFQYINDNDFSNDIVEAYGTVDLGWFGGLHYAGVRFRFNGQVDAINSSVDPVAQTFPIPAGTERFILAADWENDVGAVPFEIEGPDGTIYTEADFDNTMIGLLPEFADETSKSVGLLHPTPGDWTIRIPESDALGEVVFHGFHDSVAPTVTITSLDSSTETIHFAANDNDSAAKVTLFYDVDNSGQDGRIIADGLAESDGPGSHTWNTTGVRSGEYFVYAKITDENNPPTYVYSADKITVANQPPVMSTIDTQSVRETEKLTFQVTATDPNRERLSYALGAGAPEGASIDRATGEFSWTPTDEQGPGQYSVTVQVTDNGVGTLSAMQTFDIQVTENNRSPQLGAILDQFTIEGNAIRFTAVATDGNLPANTLSFSLDAGAPDGAAIDPATGEFSWTPNESQGPGSFTITARVTDDGNPNLSGAQTFHVTVGEANQSPTIDPIANQEVAAASLLTFNVVAHDADLPVQAPTFSLASDAPAGAAIDPVTGVFTWTPTAAQGGTEYAIKIFASDGDLERRTVVNIKVTASAKPWQNQRDPLDVNNDTFVAPIDALIIINEINEPAISDSSGRLPDPAGNVDEYFDVSGDGIVAPNDVLEVINALNAGSGEAGESQRSPPIKTLAVQSGAAQFGIFMAHRDAAITRPKLRLSRAALIDQALTELTEPK